MKNKEQESIRYSHIKETRKEKVTYQGNTRHNESGNKRAQHTTSRSILQTRPPEHIEITCPVHMSRIQLAGDGVQHIIVDEHLIPRRDEVGGHIESDLQVTVHSQEPRKRTIDRIMERDTIECIQRRIAQEVLILTR